MGDPTKLVLGGLINDLLSQERVLRDMAKANLESHIIEAKVSSAGRRAPRFEASGIIEHIKIETSGENEFQKPASALISFRGREKSQKETKLHQLIIGTDAHTYSRGYRLDIRIYQS